MTIVRNGDDQILDFTPAATLIPRTDNALGALGLFEDFYGETTTVEIERITQDYDVLEASQRGGDRNYAGEEKSQIEAFRIPFFTSDKVIKAKEVQDFREYATAAEGSSVETRVDRALARILLNHDFLKRKAMYACLKGSTYAEGLAGTQYVKDLATVWGVTGDVFTGGIDFTDPTADPALYVEKNCREHIINQAQNNAEVYSVVALCGSGFFNSLTHNPFVQAAFSAYSSDQEVLRKRLGRNGQEDTVGREFFYKGVTYLEDVSGEIARDEAYVFPVGIQDMFMTHYAPSDTIEGANDIAEASYVWLDITRRTAKLESETSFVCINTRPELVCKLTSNNLAPNA